jgi:hypothetical protein
VVGLCLEQPGPKGNLQPDRSLQLGLVGERAEVPRLAGRPADHLGDLGGGAAAASHLDQRVASPHFLCLSSPEALQSEGAARGVPQEVTAPGFNEHGDDFCSCRFE